MYKNNKCDLSYCRGCEYSKRITKGRKNDLYNLLGSLFIAGLLAYAIAFSI